MSASWRKLKHHIQSVCSQYNNVLIMVSGGVDSMFLLDFICRNTAIKPTVIHFQHCIRSDDHREVDLIRAVSSDKDLKFVLGSGLGLKNIRNQESVARGQRWGFVESIINDLDGSTVVLTAHHFDDQIEHFFMSSCRGRNIKSLLMKSVTSFDGYDKFKPLLNFQKHDIYRTVESRKIPFIEDPTNKDLDHERNIFRNKIIPDMMEIRNLRKSMKSLFLEIENL